MTREYRPIDGVKGVTDTHVKGALADSKAWYVWDNKVAGFGCKITPAGKKVFIFQYRMKSGEPTQRITIGSLGGFDVEGRPWTVDRATKEAKKLLGLKSSGIDPIKQARDKAAEEARQEADRVRKAQLATELTVARRSALWLAYVETAKPKTHGFYSGIMNNHVVPVIGTISMPDLLRGDISRVISKIPDCQAALRRNVYATMSAFYSWTADDYEEATNLPIADVSPFQFRKRAPKVPDARERVLDDKEILLIWKAANKLSPPFNAFIHLLLTTVQRRSEVAGLDWRELNRESRQWVLPATRSKNGKSHVVHLGKLAVATIDRLAGGENWPAQGLTITTNGNKSLGGFSYVKRLLDAALADLATEEGVALPAHWIIHDIRRTGATKLQSLGIRLEVTEAVLNHQGKSKTGLVAVYQKYDFAAEKASALDALDADLQRILKLNDHKNVVPIRRNKLTL